MNDLDATIRVNVDPINPGQFFACCGLLELADRLWDGAKAGLKGERSASRRGGGLAELIGPVTEIGLTQLDPDDNTASPIEVCLPARPLRLDLVARRLRRRQGIEGLGRDDGKRSDRPSDATRHAKRPIPCGRTCSTSV